MKRSMIATVLTLAALIATGCGQSPTSGVPYKPTTVSRTSTASTAASVPAAAAQVGAVALQLSSLKSASALEVKLTGPGLAAPLTRRLTSDELSASNTVSFENLPVGAYTVSLAAFDAKNKSLGAKTTSVQVQADQPTKVGLQLSLNAGSLAFTTVDAESLNEAESAPEAEATPAPKATATPAPASSAEPDDENAALGIEVVSKETVRKYFLFKKLAVTVKVTNHNPTETLSGTVKIDFYATSGIINKTTKLAETMVQDVKNLAPGKSVELTIQSTKSAVDAEATVHTVVSSATASTSDE
jgi:hypothetical protein